MGKIFIISFVCFAFIYAVLASMTTLLYRHKSPIDLSLLERAVLYRRATIGDRLTLFITNLFASVVAPPVYILAAIITFIIWAIWRMIVDWITGILYYFVFTPLALYWVYYIYKNGNKYTMNNYVYFMFIVCSFWLGHLFYHASYKFFWIIPDTWGSYWSAESDTWESYKSQISMFIAFVGSIAFVGTMENWLPKLKSHNKSNV